MGDIASRHSVGPVLCFVALVTAPFTASAGKAIIKSIGCGPVRVADALEQAGRKPGHVITRESVAVLETPEVFVGGAALRGLEDVPAAALADGVNVALAALALPFPAGDPRGPRSPGIYLLRARATTAAIQQAILATSVGVAPPRGNAVLSFHELDGTLVTEMPAYLQWAYAPGTPGARPAGPSFDVSRESAFDPTAPGGTAAAKYSIKIWVYGRDWRVCIEIVFF